MNRMAVPAALILISSGISLKALTMTAVSSQSLRLSGSEPFPSFDWEAMARPPAKAQMTKARLETLFEAGSFMVAFKVGGDASVYCFIFSNHSLAINLQK
jgi:hypothetical protein